jgi:AraC-like DNA-binding protein
MGVSERTLQRRLQEEGTSLQKLSDAVRHELALEWLCDAALSGSEIARRLGYANHAAFSRAFRRWRGASPAEHRRALREQSRAAAEAAAPPLSPRAEPSQRKRPAPRGDESLQVPWQARRRGRST